MTNVVIVQLLLAFKPYANNVIFIRRRKKNLWCSLHQNPIFLIYYRRNGQRRTYLCPFIVCACTALTSNQVQLVLCACPELCDKDQIKSLGKYNNIVKCRRDLNERLRYSRSTDSVCMNELVDNLYRRLGIITKLISVWTRFSPYSSRPSYLILWAYECC